MSQRYSRTRIKICGLRQGGLTKGFHSKSALTASPAAPADRRDAMGSLGRGGEERQRERKNREGEKEEKREELIFRGPFGISEQDYLSTHWWQ